MCIPYVDAYVACVHTRSSLPADANVRTHEVKGILMLACIVVAIGLPRVMHGCRHSGMRTYMSRYSRSAAGVRHHGCMDACEAWAGFAAVHACALHQPHGSDLACHLCSGISNNKITALTPGVFEGLTMLKFL